jgi:hypothetical protein
MIATLGELLTSLETTLSQAIAVREVALAGVAGMAVLLLAQIGIMAWTVRRLRELGHLRERMSRLADGLSLLTDTTEAGLQTIIRQVEHLGRTAIAVRPAPRAAVSRRVSAAARKGQPLAQIAERELLSESEVRLHLTMAGAASADSKGESACLAASTSR